MDVNTPQNGIAPPISAFTFNPTLTPFNISPTTYMSTHPTYNALVTGGMVFHPLTSTHTAISPTRILLIRRAANDFMPNLWEIPGGSTESTDPTILHGLVREVFEETGLRVSHVEKLESERCFKGRKMDWGQKVYGKFEFVVVVVAGQAQGKEAEELEVKVDENEHSDWMWVTEEECREGRAKGRGGEAVGLEFTTREQREAVLKAFRARKEGGGGKL